MTGCTGEPEASCAAESGLLRGEMSFRGLHISISLPFPSFPQTAQKEPRLVETTERVGRQKSSCGKKQCWRHGGPGGLSHCPRAGCTETVWQMGCLEMKLLEVLFCKRELCLKDSCNEPTEPLCSLFSTTIPGTSTLSPCGEPGEGS